MRWLIMSHLIWINTVFNLIFEVWIWYGLDEIFFESFQMKIMSPAKDVVKEYVGKKLKFSLVTFNDFFCDI